jgi:hypothetical protein
MLLPLYLVLHGAIWALTSDFIAGAWFSLGITCWPISKHEILHHDKVARNAISFWDSSMTKATSTLPQMKLETAKIRMLYMCAHFELLLVHLK